MTLEAMTAWQNPMWDGIFHETGWIVTTCGDPAATEHLKKSYQNLKDQGQAANIDFVEVKEQIARYVPQLRGAKGIDDWKGLWNKQAGWWSKCWTLAHIELTEEEVKVFKGIPVVDNHELGFTFEPDPETRWMKICNAFPGYDWKQGSYTNKEGETTRYSVPRYASDHPDGGIPDEARDGINAFVDRVLPQFNGRPLLGARICWCTDSPDSYYLIDTHAEYANLLLATGDSGHAFKMLHIIGSYIADALEGICKKEWKYGDRKAVENPTRPGDVVKELNDVGMGGTEIVEGSMKGVHVGLVRL